MLYVHCHVALFCTVKLVGNPLCYTYIAMSLCSVLWNYWAIPVTVLQIQGSATVWVPKHLENSTIWNDKDRKGFYCVEDWNTHRCTEYWRRMINHPAVPAGLSELVGLTFPNLSRLSALTAQFDSTHTGNILCGSDNLLPEPPVTAHSCGQHGPVTAWFWSARPGNILPVPKTSAVLVLRLHCLNGIASVQFKFCVLSEFDFVINWIASQKLQSPENYATMCECVCVFFFNAEKKFWAECAVSPLTSLPVRSHARRDQATWRRQ